jgi:hypothetical protein
MSQYTPPGVNVREIVSPQVAPLLASPANVCLVGLSQGYQVRTDQVLLTGTSPIPLPYLASLPGSTLVSVLSVKDALNPSKGAANGSGYVLSTDYTVNTGAGTITRQGSGGIEDPTLVNVTYEYVPANYFEPIRLFDQGSVESRFGPSFNAEGNGINSHLSYAANLAFQNGAGSLILQPLFTRATPGNPTTTASQPNATQAAAAVTWADTLYILRSVEELDILVPVVGQSEEDVTDAAQLAIFQTVQDHEAFMNGQQQYIVGILGEDSSASDTVASMSTIRSHAVTLQSRYGGDLNQQNVLVNTSAFGVPLPSVNSTLAVGGQYMAAAIAGAVAARPPSAGLTKKAIAGFSAVLDTRLLSDKNIDAETGLMVIEQKKTNVLCRQQLTLDTTSTARKELSVVRAKFIMIESIRETLENEVIGQIIADANSPYVVRSAINAVLSALQQAGDIVSYSQVQASLSSLEPTTISASFSYRPSFPVNYVTVSFSLDLSTQTVTASSETTNTESTL